MVGIDKLREYLGEFNANYVIIGGTACNLHLEDADLQGRATKDIDKHKKDIYRLSFLFSGEERYDVSDSIQSNLRDFISELRTAPISTKAIAKAVGVVEVPMQDFILKMETLFQL